MQNYDYLIVGGGMTAGAATGGIRKVDSQGSIGIITDEQHPPYKRPPLSKGLWKGDPAESIWLKEAMQSASLHTTRTVVRLDLPNKTASDDHGDMYTFRKLLLATGGRVRKLPYDVPG